MVTLEQIRQLDARVRRAIEVIGKLRDENYTLKNRLAEYQDRIEELEVLIANFKEDQSEIEQGIVHVISELEHLEDGPAAAKAATPAAKAASPEAPAAPSRSRAQHDGTAAPRTRPPTEARPADPVAPAPSQEQGADETDSSNPESELDIF